MSFDQKYPEKLYRTFTKKEQADAFTAGHIRFRNILTYISIKDKKRKDPTEGSGLYINFFNGHDTTILSAHPTYILCCSLPGAAKGSSERVSPPKSLFSSKSIHQSSPCPLRVEVWQNHYGQNHFSNGWKLPCILCIPW